MHRMHRPFRRAAMRCRLSRRQHLCDRQRLSALSGAGLRRFAMKFTLTPAAQKFIRRMVQFSAYPGGGFRLSVSPGGCSGLSALFDVEAAPRAGDQEFVVDGVKFYLPAESRLLLDGVTIDFAESSTSGGLVFHDPKNTGSCKSTSAPIGEHMHSGRVPMVESEPAVLSPDEKEFLAGALLGEGLPAEAEEFLDLASKTYADSETAERYLRQAQQWAPDHAAVLIGLYRFYFYKGRLREALEIANRCLEKATRENNMPRDWRRARAQDAVFDRYDEMLPRFFLFTLKGYAYLQMRLGALDESRVALAKLLELDPSDKIGAKVLLGVLDRIGVEDDA